VPEVTNGKITLSVEGENLTVYETQNGKRYRRALFHLGELMGLVVPHMESLLSGAARQDIEGHIGKALDGVFGDEKA